MQNNSFDIIYVPGDIEKRCIISLPTEIDKLQQPITIYRDQSEEQEDGSKQIKRKTEAVEIEDELYLKLKEKEKNPLTIVDSEHKVFTGMLQDNSIGDKHANDNYFVLINAGTSFKMLPVKFWYRFFLKNQSELTLEEAEQKMKLKEDFFKEKRKLKNEDKEIDYDEKFDDDSENDVFLEEEQDNELSVTGEELKNLMKNYEDESSDDNESVKGESVDKTDKATILKRKGDKKQDNKRFNNNKSSR